MPAPDSWHALYPFRSQRLELDGVGYHYLDHYTGGNSGGEGGDTFRPEPLLFVHGNPTWTFYWRNLIAALGDRYRCLAVDHVGCGLSDKPPDYPYRLAQHVDNLARLVDELDLEQVTLVAHDWGGAIALGAALAAPRRFARLVLLNTGAWVPERIPLRIRLCRAPVAGTLAVRGLNLFARAALRMAVERHERMTPAVRAGLLAPYGSWGERIAIERFVQDIPLRPSHPSYATLDAIWSGLPSLADRPVQLIWGMRDWCFTPACLERFLTVFPDADVHRLEDAGHYVVEDAHERIAPLVAQFIAAHPVELAR